jgi:uncharacterized phiE125 gp8 family phage protein
VTAYTLKTAATIAALDLDQAKQQVRIAPDWSDEDLVIQSYIDAATRWIEEYTGRSLLTQTWQASICAFPARLWLPRAAPLQAVTFVKYYNGANVLTTLSSSVYTVPAFHEPAYLTLVDGQSWPSVFARDDAVQIEYVTGVTNPMDVPAPLTQAIQLLVGHWHANREDVVVSGAVPKTVPMAVTALCAPYRTYDRVPQWEAA